MVIPKLFWFGIILASNACVNTHRSAGKKIPPCFSSPLACWGQRPQAPLNTEFHSVAARSANAFDQDQLTAGRGLFLFQHPVLPPFSALDLHLPLPLKASAFPHGNAGTRHRSFSFLNIKLNIKGTRGLLYYQIISMCRYAQSCAFISVIELPRIPTYCPKNWVKTALVWSNDVKLYQPV